MVKRGLSWNLWVPPLWHPTIESLMSNHGWGVRPSGFRAVHGLDRVYWAPDCPTLRIPMKQLGRGVVPGFFQPDGQKARCGDRRASGSIFLVFRQLRMKGEEGVEADCPACRLSAGFCFLCSGTGHLEVRSV